MKNTGKIQTVAQEIESALFVQEHKYTELLFAYLITYNEGNPPSLLLLMCILYSTLRLLCNTNYYNKTFSLK